MNRATADTAQDTAETEGLAPLMLWVKRLADQVIQDLLGHPDLEFAWGDLTPSDPGEQAKVIDIYVRDGIYAVNEARGLLGLDPVPGGELPMVYGTQGAMPLGTSGAAPGTLKRASACEHGLNCGCDGGRGTNSRLLHKYNPDEPPVPAGSPQGGEWTDGGDGGDVRVAALKCDGFPAGCQSGGSYGSNVLFNVFGRNLCWDCAVKSLGLENEPAAEKLKELDKWYIDRE